ncbi:MAG: tetratricopeptide repeat protein [Ignavibacteria bacterium]|nr:tetratricopeptide repeat protein [Ignavibacteria bacterium]
MKQNSKILWFEKFFPKLLKKPYRDAIAEVRELYRNSGGDSENRGVALFAEGLLNRYSNKYDRAMSLYDKAMKYFRDSDSPEWIAALEHGIGHCYDLQGKLNEAEQHYISAFRYYNKNKIPKREAMLCVNLGKLYFERADYTNSLKYYNRAYKLFIQLKDIHAQAVTLNNLASVYKANEEYNKALKFCKESTSIFIRLGDSEKIAGNYTNIGSIYFQIGNLSMSKKNLLKALKYADKKNPNYIYINALINLASVLIKEKKYEEAFKHLLNANNMACRTNDILHRVKSDIAFGDYYVETGNILSAKKHYLSALEKISAQNYLNTELELLKKISEIFDKDKDYMESLKYFKRYHEIYFKIHSRTVSEQIANLKSTFEKEKAEKEAEILRLRNLELKRELEFKTRELNQAANYIVCKNDLIDSVIREVKNYINEHGPLSDTSEFNQYLNRVELKSKLNDDLIYFENNLNRMNIAFLDKLSRKYPELSRIELKICSLMKINLGTKEIAKLMSVSPRTIETHCHHIIQKLRLPKGKRLSSFIHSL